MSNDNLFDESDLIHAYTRANAIEDGVLVDVTERAKELGFKFPVAITLAAWNACIKWTPQDAAKSAVPNDESGRLHDVLWQLYNHIKRDGKQNPLPFAVLAVRPGDRGGKVSLIELKSFCGPGDSREPVITIMLPDED
jgi:hypothetical protein